MACASNLPVLGCCDAPSLGRSTIQGTIAMWRALSVTGQGRVDLDGWYPVCTVNLGNGQTGSSNGWATSQQAGMTFLVNPNDPGVSYSNITADGPATETTANYRADAAINGVSSGTVSFSVILSGPRKTQIELLNDFMAAAAAMPYPPPDSPYPRTVDSYVMSAGGAVFASRQLDDPASAKAFLNARTTLRFTPAPPGLLSLADPDTVSFNLSKYRYSAPIGDCRCAWTYRSAVPNSATPGREISCASSVIPESVEALPDIAPLSVGDMSLGGTRSLEFSVFFKGPRLNPLPGGQACSCCGNPFA